jgi:hypothetical protein
LASCAISFVICVSSGPAARAHQPHECAGLPDEPALAGHIEHHDIAEGALSLRETIEAGRG